MPKDAMNEGETKKNRLIFDIVFELILTPINAYWIALVSGIYHSLNPAYTSLFIVLLSLSHLVLFEDQKFFRGNEAICFHRIKIHATGNMFSMFIPAIPVGCTFLAYIFACRYQANIYRSHSTPE